MANKEKFNQKDIIKLANELILKSIPLPILKKGMSSPVFIQILEDLLIRLYQDKKLLLPNFHENVNTIAVFSDYGGESQKSSYFTYTFLFVAYEALYYSLNHMTKMRRDHGLMEPYREICFKNKEYGPIHRILDDWLKIADYIPGLLLTLLIPKDIISVVGKNEKKDIYNLTTILQKYGYGDWKPNVVEKMMRILHLIAYCCALLSKQGHKIFWMTDDDSIAPNKEKEKAMQQIFSNILEIYAPNKYNSVYCGRPFKDIHKKQNICDLLSYPDLVAGSIEAYFSNCYETKDPLIKEEANEVLLWLVQQGFGMKKLTILLGADTNGNLQSSIVEFKTRATGAGLSF